MSRGLHNAASFTTIVRNQAALPAIKAFVLVDNPLVEATLAQGFSPGLLSCFRFPEVDDFSHDIVRTCHDIAIVIPAFAGMKKSPSSNVPF